jgi:A/G-specific adenine glycosylase
VLLAVNAQNQVLLEQRPARGVWARLWALPMFASEEELLAAVSGAAKLEHLPAFVHVLTHRDLHLHPVLVWRGKVEVAGLWCDAQQWQNLGLPAPVRRLLESLQ